MTLQRFTRSIAAHEFVGFSFGAALCLVANFAAKGQPLALFSRVANTTLRMPASPPVFGFTTEKAFGNLSFTQPVAIATPPGESNRLFVIEKAGRLIVITNLANPTRTVFMDISDRVISDAESESWRISLRLADGVAQVLFPRIANRGFEVQWTTNLFDPTSWQPLDAPGNRPIIAATTQPAVQRIHYSRRPLSIIVFGFSNIEPQTVAMYLGP